MLGGAVPCGRKNNVEFGETGTFLAKENIGCHVELLIKYDGNRTGGKYWDVWGKVCGENEGGSDEGTPQPFPPSQSPPQVQQAEDGRDAGPSCSQSRGSRRDGGPIRRMRVNGIRARASASVIGELSWRMRRFERGEGGGVT